MAITVQTSRRVLREYLVYDLEWIPGTLEIRMVGVYDGNRYRSYSSIEAFIANEMTSKNRGKWFYAHAGGLADFSFLLEKLVNRYPGRYEINGAFSGSSAIIVKVKQLSRSASGRVQAKNCWHFIDSYWLLKDTLRNIGKWIGIAKGNADQKTSFYRDASYAELRDYNEIDCIILWRAIRHFEETILEIGGQLQRTQAATAMDLFRRRFLTQDITTSRAINDIARQAYVASRVEVLSTVCHDAYYYDVNSSFPYAMTFAVPGELTGSSRQLPDHGLYLADCLIDVPETWLPPLPIRRGGRIFFPVGSWRGWFSNVDLQLLLDSGGRIRRVYESISFEPCYDLKDYATVLFERRKQSTGFERIAYKYLLNSLYGKFAESEFKDGLLVNPPHIDPEWRMLFPGTFIVERRVPIPHMHVPISVHITSIARRTLFQYMGQTSEVHYCDTDGFSSKDPFLIVGKELGDIKLEKRIIRGRFYQPKVYQLEGTDADGKDLSLEVDDDGLPKSPDGVKAKGFGGRMTLERMAHLIEGQELEYVRMKRIRELVRSGNLVPREETIRKRLRLTSISKRFFYPDGQSRPWHISELNQVYPKRDCS